MDFSFNSDQKMIAEAAETYLSSISTSEAVRLAMDTERGFDALLWEQIGTEMGWPLTHIPEEYDGLGLGFVELCILHEKMGQNLLCAPFFSTVAQGVNALLVAGTTEQKQAGLLAIAEGAARYAFAYSGGTRKVACDSVTASYTLTDEGAVLNGQYHYVIDGHTADFLVVAARQHGSVGDDAIALFTLPVDHPGISRRWTPSMDQTRKLASIELTDVTLNTSAIMRDAGNAGPHLNDILALSNICLAAEQLGVAEKSLILTVEYIKERTQFGRVVGSFQAMKHKAADMMTKVEAARSAVYYAACIADEFVQNRPLGQELQEAASIAKAYCCDAAFFNAGTAMQMHGGVGFTWEYDVHLYFKRAKAAQLSFGDSAWHKEKLAQILLGECS